MEIPRPEYPRPDFVREDWLNLNGEWEFDFDDGDRGLNEEWFYKHDFSRKIIVPFTFESVLSGIGDHSVHEVVWYRRTFRLPDSYRGRRVLLNFGAVDYNATVWVNGEKIIEHRGGYTPFRCDITESLKPANTLVVRVEDRMTQDQPRGKQYWKPESAGCHYSRATGIWQTVWLEPVSVFHIKEARFLPDIDESRVKAAIKLSGHTDKTRILMRITSNGKTHAEAVFQAASDDASVELRLDEPRLWSPEMPDLYNVMLEVLQGDAIYDRVLAYFGMRKISIENGQVMLNNEPYRLKLVLDQGYYPDGIYTAPDDYALRRDVELAKAFGFNGVRKHQKIEDPRYYYWCDKLGLLAWAEMASAYSFNDTSVANFAAEWPNVVRANYNHPSIVAWVPFNESWGIGGVENRDRQQEFVGQIVSFTRELDPTRLVVDNSGWSHVDTDIVDVHDYTQDEKVLDDLLSHISTSKPELPLHTHKRKTMAEGFTYQGQPVVVSEYGGIALTADAKEGAWGYGNAAASTKELTSRYAKLTEAILRNGQIAGFCYTQLYDVEQEVNGLLTYDRKPKVDAEKISEINNAMAGCEC